MLKRTMMVGLAVLALVSGSLAHARQDGGPMSPQHMSQQGRESANSPMMGQEKGMDRAMERKSDSGDAHGMTGKSEDRGYARGHDKDKGRGKAKGHDR